MAYYDIYGFYYIKEDFAGYSSTAIIATPQTSKPLRNGGCNSYENSYKSGGGKCYKDCPADTNQTWYVEDNRICYACPKGSIPVDNNTRCYYP